MIRNLIYVLFCLALYNSSLAQVTYKLISEERCSHNIIVSKTRAFGKKIVLDKENKTILIYDRGSESPSRTISIIKELDLPKKNGIKAFYCNIAIGETNYDQKVYFNLNEKEITFKPVINGTLINDSYYKAYY